GNKVFGYPPLRDQIARLFEIKGFARATSGRGSVYTMLDAALMSPDAASCVNLHLPGGIVNLTCTPAVFNVESRRRTQVKGDHVVISVLSQLHHDRDIACLTKVVGGADIVKRLQLQHEVV